jgi:hypothetical protein
MRARIRTLQFAILASALVALPAAAGAQRSQRGQPKTPFAATDFAKLRWLEGNWAGTAQGEPDVFGRYHFTSDSTIDITYYRDRAMTQASANGRVYLTMGRVYHTLGPGRWGATHVGADGAYFVPQVNAHNTFDWSYESPDSWSATMRSGVSGHDRVVIYEMKRIGG